MARITEYASATTLNEGLFFVVAIDIDQLGNFVTRRVSLATLRERFLTSVAIDGASAVGFPFNTSVDLVTVGAKLMALSNNGVERFSVDKDGVLVASFAQAGLYFSTPAATVLAADTPALAAGTTTVQGAAASLFAVDAAGRLTYTAEATRSFELNASITLTKAAGTPTVATAYLYKDGAAITGLEIDVDIDDGETVTLTLTGTTTLAQNEYVELWVSTVNGDDLTVQKGVVRAMEIR